MSLHGVKIQMYGGGGMVTNTLNQKTHGKHKEIKHKN